PPPGPSPPALAPDRAAAPALALAAALVPAAAPAPVAAAPQPPPRARVRVRDLEVRTGELRWVGSGELLVADSGAIAVPSLVLVSDAGRVRLTADLSADRDRGQVTVQGEDL